MGYCISHIRVALIQNSDAELLLIQREEKAKTQKIGVKTSNDSMWHQVVKRKEKELRMTPRCLGLPRWLSGKESTCSAEAAGDAGLIPESGRSPGGGHGNPLKYSCLENPVDRGTCTSIGSQRVRHNWSDLAHTLLSVQVDQVFSGFSFLFSLWGESGRKFHMLSSRCLLSS